VLAEGSRDFIRRPCLRYTLRPPHSGNIPVYGHISGDDNDFNDFSAVHLLAPFAYSDAC